MAIHSIHADQYDSKFAYLDAKKGAELAEAIGYAVNGNGEAGLIQGFASEFACQHRTLQAGAVRVLLQALVKYAKDADANQATDLRNEAAVKLLLKLAPIVDDTPVPFI